MLFRFVSIGGIPFLLPNRYNYSFEEQMEWVSEYGLMSPSTINILHKITQCCLPLSKTWNLYQTLKKRLKSTCSQRNNSGFLNVLLLSCTFLLCIQLICESLVTIECLFVYCHWTLYFVYLIAFLVSLICMYFFLFLFSLYS